eukprot:2302393-Prymnesium_polylepis.1
MALFKRVWAILAAAETAPNEQDLLNRELARSSELRWKVLPSVDFPNGFVYFMRPIPGLSRPVLLHVNWIGGVDEKVYHLREAGLWTPGTGDFVDNRRFLTIGEWIEKVAEGPMGFAAQRRSLRDALAIADALNRTLILPRLPVAMRGPSRRNSRTIAHFFDYGSLVRQFPNVRAKGPDSQQLVGPVSRVHIDIGRGDEPPPEAGFAVVRARTKVGLTDKSIRRKLAPFAGARVLHLSTSYRRASLARTSSDQSRLDVGMYRGIQPAARLQNLARFVRHAVRKGRRRYDCIDASGSVEFSAVLQPMPASQSNMSRADRKAASITTRDIIQAAAHTLRTHRRQ